MKDEELRQRLNMRMMKGPYHRGSLKPGFCLDEIWEITRIDKYFLKMKNIIDFARLLDENELIMTCCERPRRLAFPILEIASIKGKQKKRYEN